MKLTIVIITWKMKNYLVRCIESIKQSIHELDYEIIVIDNNSNDGTLEWLYENKENYNLKIFSNDRNLGVAPARNIGLVNAKGKYILILDADIEVKSNAINILVDYLDNDMACGMVGSKLVYPDLSPQANCKRFPSLFTLLIKRFDWLKLVRDYEGYQRHIMSDFNHEETITVDYLIGACQLFRKELLVKVGLLDENIFYGPEDIDFCLRIRSTGSEIVYNCESIMVHYEQRITKKRIISKITFMHFLGILYFLNKYNWNPTVKNVRKHHLK